MRGNRLRGAVRSRLARGVIALSGVGLVAVPMLVSIEHAQAAAACSVGYTVVNSWNSGSTNGFQGSVVITNLGDPITSWSLQWSFAGNQQISQLWNGNVTQTGQNVTVTNASYNGSLGTNASASPGFIASFTGANAVPAAFVLNGTACNGGPSPSPSVSPSATPTPTPTPSQSPTPTPSTSPTAQGPHPANPYLGATQYLNPDYVSEVNAQVAADGGNSHEAKVATWQTGIWMDRIAAIAGDSTHLGLQAHLDHALTTRQGSTPEVVEVVIYDLPGRDCAALASNGELPATAAGLTTYETQYINPIVSILGNSKYSSLRISAIIEPDSLPNVVTNQSKPACSTATPFYEQGIEYALNHLHAISNVWNYVDIAHSAWLGWPSNMNPAGQEFAKVARATTAGFASIDGFISDTANYTPTAEPFLPNPTMNVGGQQLDSVNFYQFNPTFDEVTYDTLMHNTLLANGFPTAPFLIDTSRNGWGGPQRPTALNSSPTTATAYVAANKVDQRGFRGNWCNQNNSGIGTPPAVQPFGASSPIIGFVWIKPPGESDGDYPTATHAHGDPHCDPNSTNTDGNGNTYPTGSIPGFDVPAGQWFPAEFQMLVRNSFPAL
jgi:cellulose 1,4-beta-cellobiosidase